MFDELRCQMISAWKAKDENEIMMAEMRRWLELQTERVQVLESGAPRAQTRAEPPTDASEATCTPPTPTNMYLGDLEEVTQSDTEPSPSLREVTKVALQHPSPA